MRLIGTTRITNTIVVTRLWVNWVEVMVGMIWCRPT